MSVGLDFFETYFYKFQRAHFRWVEYGAIDHTIIDKLQNEEEPRVRLQGAEELNRCVLLSHFV